MRTRPLAGIALAVLLSTPALAWPTDEGRPAFVQVPIVRPHLDQGRPAPLGVVAERLGGVPVMPPRPHVTQPEPVVRVVHAHAAATLQPRSVPVRSQPSGSRVRSGIASRMGPGFGSAYLALPGGPGIRVRICGTGGCVTMTSTDAGPAKFMQRAPYYRVADLNDIVWQRVSGLPLSAGLCRVTVAYL